MQQGAASGGQPANGRPVMKQEEPGPSFAPGMPLLQET